MGLDETSRLETDTKENTSFIVKGAKNEDSILVKFNSLGRNEKLHKFKASLIMAAFSVGMFKMVLKDRASDGYTPETSRSRYETDIYKQFFGAAGDTLPTTMVITAKDKGSMHRLRYLDEADKFITFIQSNLTVPFPTPENPQKLVKYNDICGVFCNSNQIIHYFYLALLNEYEKSKGGKKINKLTYPKAKVSGYTLPLEKNFFGVKKDHYTVQDLINNPEVADLINVADFDFVELLFATFLANISSLDNEEMYGVWELGAAKYIAQNYTSDLIQVQAVGARIVDYEMNKSSQKTIPYFAFGFSIMFVFVILTIFSSAIYFKAMDKGKVFIAIGIAICPVLAVTTTFGVFSILGLRTNSVMLIMPFLIMGIGINDSFLMVHSFLKPSYKNIAPVTRLGLVFEDVGPSITITTLTNVITFGIGALTPTPEIALFCMASAVALGFAYIFALTLFGPILFYSAVYEHSFSQAKDTTIYLESGVNKLKLFFKSFRTLYCNILSSNLFACLLLVVVSIYWYFAITGTLNIQSRLDTEKILPQDSPLLEPHKLIAHVVWEEYYPVTVFVNNPMDIRSNETMEIFNKMVGEFESLESCLGPDFSMVWIRDYQEYIKDNDGFALWEDFLDDNTYVKEEKNETLDYSNLKGFLRSPIQKHWNAFIKLNQPNTFPTHQNPISKFWFLVAYKNIDSWDKRISLMIKWRQIADKYNSLNVTVWESNAMFVDQMLSLKTLTMQTVVITLLCMTIVCAIFIQNPLAVATAVLSIFSICLGVVGFISFWSLDLDPVSLGAVLMSIGMSVDFTAHVCYHFQLRNKRNTEGVEVVKVPLLTTKDKLNHTIDSVAWPMLQGGISTVLCVFPLICLKDYIPLVFFKTICLVAIWGLFHGLILLPTFMCFIPRNWIEWSCYRYLNKQEQLLPESEIGHDEEQQSNV
uniref:SSD domain-containing protein n=1 Tax=Rhabditophanes sp. KR3021 TaxID=114890 RepID=A0AC35TGZ3_9BILA